MYSSLTYLHNFHSILRLEWNPYGIFASKAYRRADRSVRRFLKCNQIFKFKLLLLFIWDFILRHVWWVLTTDGPQSPLTPGALWSAYTGRPALVLNDTCLSCPALNAFTRCCRSQDVNQINRTIIGVNFIIISFKSLMKGIKRLPNEIWVPKTICIITRKGATLKYANQVFSQWMNL